MVYIEHPSAKLGVSQHILQRFRLRKAAHVVLRLLQKLGWHFGSRFGNMLIGREAEHIAAIEHHHTAGLILGI